MWCELLKALLFHDMVELTFGSTGATPVETRNVVSVH